MPRKELTVEDWFFEIEKGLEYRRRYGLEQAWPMLEALFANVHESQAQSAPNIVASTGDTLLSQLFVPYPYITPEARHPNFVESMPVVEHVDNMLIDDMGMSDEVEQMGLSSYLYSVGFGKIGYDSEYGTAPKLDIGGKKDPLGLTLTQFDKKQNRIEYGKAQPGMPWFKSVLPHDIVLPWGTRDVETAEWIVHRVCRHVDDCKADLKYNTKDLKGSMSTEDFMKTYMTAARPYKLGNNLSRDSMTNRDNGKQEYVELWEIHDKRTGKVIVIATGHQEFLRNDVDYLQVNGLPFVQLKFWPSSRSIWGTSDAYYLLQAQLELTDIHLQARNHRRASVLKGVFAEDAFSEEELNKMLSSRVGVFAKVNSSADIDKSVRFIQGPPNPMLYNDAQVVRRNAGEVVGISRVDTGELEQGGRRTAYEIAASRSGGDQRSNRRQAKVADVYEKTFKIINPILGQFWNTNRVAQILTPEEGQKWVEFNGDVFKHNYKYSMCFSSEPPHSRSVDKQFALQMAPFVMQDPLADPVEVRKWLMRAVGSPDFQRIYAPKIGGSTGADLSVQLQQMQGGAGGVQNNGGQGGGSVQLQGVRSSG